MPLTQNFYRCDSVFHLEMLRAQLVDHSRTGFIIIDGQSVTFHTLSGNQHHVIFDWQSISLPKKHGRGGQSQNRFARIRTEKRDWFLTSVEELTIQHFIDVTTGKPNVVGLILAGNADFKTELSKRLDKRLQSIVLGIVDIQYNGTQGFHEALDKAEPFLQGLSYYEEKKDLATFFERTRTDGAVAFGPNETYRVLVESGGAVDKLLVWSDLALFRRVLKRGDDIKWQLRMPDQELKIDDGWELLEETLLLTWLIEHGEDFGASISLVSGHTPAGSQFIAGFGGLGALLRYHVEMIEEDKEEREEDAEDFEW